MKGADKYVHCLYCNCASPLRYKRTIRGRVKVTRKCCGDLVGFYDFPDGMTRQAQTRLLAYLNE